MKRIEGLVAVPELPGITVPFKVEKSISRKHTFHYASPPNADGTGWVRRIYLLKDFNVLVQVALTPIEHERSLQELLADCPDAENLVIERDFGGRGYTMYEEMVD